MKLWLFAAVLPLLSFGQSKNPCTDLQLDRYWAASPVHAQAEELARELRTAGIQVQCIRRSKEENIFNGQSGAAWFKTDQGVFEVWFLPKAESFNNLRIIEHTRDSGRFVYSFAGTPQIQTSFDSSQRIWFIKQRNILFEVWGDSKLAARIKALRN